MTIVSLRHEPQLLEPFIAFFASHWGNEPLYRDCMTAALATPAPLPQWFLMLDDRQQPIAGCGLITNDFNARMDLCPFLAALFVEEPCRGHAYGAQLLDHARRQCAILGFPTLHLITDHCGYYERYGFDFRGHVAEPGGGSARLYAAPAICGWDELVAAATATLNPRRLSDTAETGGVAAALLAPSGRIYTGVCLDTACSLGFCAERNAIGTMLTHGESHVLKLVAVGAHRLLPPCGACRELLLQLDPRNADAQVLCHWPNPIVRTLAELMPLNWRDIQD